MQEKITKEFAGRCSVRRKTLDVVIKKSCLPMADSRKL